jgi:tetratricopeptide (TPR) repeat protein
MNRQFFLSSFAATIVGCMALASTAYGKADDQFAQANQEYAQGKFREAAADYEGMAGAGQWSANLFYDLGNAYFRQGDFGRAILNYERALALDPHHPEAQTNLRLAREQARALELPQNWPERLLQSVTPNQLAIAAAIAFWVAAFCITARVFSRRRRPITLGLAGLCSVVLALLVYTLVAIENGGKGRSLAIVTGAEINARLATADNTSTVLTLPAGSEIIVLRQRGDWTYAALPNNLRGWVPSKGVQQVRL